MGKKQYQHPYVGKWTQIAIRCTPRQKMKFDEVVTATHKSKTQLIHEMIETKYRELFIDGEER